MFFSIILKLKTINYDELYSKSNGSVFRKLFRY